MFTTKIRRLAIFVSLLLILLLSVKAEAADYQLIRHDTKMSCVDAQTGTVITSQFITYKGIHTILMQTVLPTQDG